jgi:hypothetical protein
VTLGSVWTASAWFKYPLATAGATWNTLFRGTNDHQVIVERSTNHIGMYDNANGTGFNDTGYNMTNLTNGWHHLAVIGSGGSQAFYIDGVSIGSAGHQSVTDVIGVGNYQGGSQNWGTFDDVRIYNRALSVGEIRDLYQQGAIVTGKSQENSVSSGLIGYWSFNGKDIDWSAGRAWERSGANVHGTLVGLTSQRSAAPGKVGQAMAFDGSNNNRIDLDSSISLGNTDWTASVWVKTTSSVGQAILSNQSGGPVTNALMIDAGKIRYYHYDGSWQNELGTNAIYADGKWHHLVWVNSSNQTMDMYVDGRLEADNVPSMRDSSASGLVGSMDELRLYSRALTAAQVKQLYALGK